MATKTNHKEQPRETNSRERKYDLDFLRVCAIIAVIIVHCVSFATAFDRQATNPLSWFGAITIDSFVRWCVPVFIMISGALIINDKAYANPGTFIKKRLLRLLPAIVAWPFIYEFWTSFLQHRGFAFAELLKGYAMGNFVTGSQLYFLFLIAGLYLLTPFISAYVCLVTRKQLWISAIGILTATTTWYTTSTLLWHYEPSLNFITQGLPYVGYFMLGYLLKDIVIKNWLIPVGVFVVGSIMIDVAVCFTQHTFLYNFFFSYPTIFVMIISPAGFLSGKLLYEKASSSLSSDNVIRFRSLITKLSGSAFGVYLIHLIILDGLVMQLGFNRSSLKDSLILVLLVIAISWPLVLLMLRIPYLRNIVK